MSPGAHLILLILSVTCHRSLAQDGSKVPAPDPEKLKKMTDRVCPTLPDVGGGKVPKWSNKMTADEVFELSLLNMGYGLTSDAIAQLPENLGWKKTVVDLIANIAQKTCATDAISNKFLNGAKNLFLYYLLKHDKFMKESGRPVDEKINATAQQQWSEIIPALSLCSGDVAPISFTDTCGNFPSNGRTVVSGVNRKLRVEMYQDKMGQLMNVRLVAEQLDLEIGEGAGETGVDIIIDSVWWMFSTTYARCYAYFYPNEDLILYFLLRFREDILTSFAERWTGAGELQNHFSLVFGPFDVHKEHENLRKCATISYDYEGLTGRQLVRPLFVTVDNTRVRNFKQAL